MSKGICIFASQIATFISKNQHMNFLNLFISILINCFPEVKENFSDQDFVNIKNIRNIRKYQRINLNKIQAKYRISVFHELLNLIKKINSIEDLREQQTIYINNLKEKINFSDEDIAFLESTVPSILNKLFGKKNEKSAIEYFRKNNGKIVSPIDMRSKYICTYSNVELYIIGKIDAIKPDGTIMEIKNRVYKFFSEIREYEWIQVQAYLEIYNLEKAELLEYMKKNELEELKIKEIPREKKLWNDLILNEIIYYFRALVNIGENKELSKIFFGLNQSEKIEFIKKIIRDNRKVI